MPGLAQLYKPGCKELSAAAVAQSSLVLIPRYLPSRCSASHLLMPCCLSRPRVEIGRNVDSFPTPTPPTTLFQHFASNSTYSCFVTGTCGPIIFSSTREVKSFNASESLLSWSDQLLNGLNTRAGLAREPRGAGSVYLHSSFTILGGDNLLARHAARCQCSRTNTYIRFCSWIHLHFTGSSAKAQPPESLRAEFLVFLFRSDIFVLLSISFALSPWLTRAEPRRLRLVTESDVVSVGERGGGGGYTCSRCSGDSCRVVASTTL